MKKTIMIVALCLFALTATQAKDFNIIPPNPSDPSLADGFTKLSGKWIGEWEMRTNPSASKLPVVLIFREIAADGTSAKIYYGPPDDTKQTWGFLTTAKITADKRKIKISFKTPKPSIYFDFTLKGGRIVSQYSANTTRGPYTWDIIMQKVQ